MIAIAPIPALASSHAFAPKMPGLDSLPTLADALACNEEPAYVRDEVARNANVDGWLTLNQAIHRAIDAHPSITDAIATLSQQQSGIGVARAGYYPQFKAGTSGGPWTSARGLGPYISASASQMLYDFGKVSHQVMQAHALAARQQAKVLGAIDDVSRDVAEAIVNVHRYQQLTIAASDLLQAVSSVKEMAELRAKAGISTRSDPIQASSRLDQARSNLIEARAMLEQSKENLRTLMNETRPLPSNICIAEPHDLPPFKPDAPVDAALDADLLPAALEAKAEAKAAEAQLGIVKAGRFPTISLDGNYGRSLRGSIYPAAPDRRQDYGSIILNVSTQMFQGTGILSQLKAASHAVEAAHARQQTALLEAHNKLRSIHAAAMGSISRLGILQDRLETIIEARDLYRDQYRLGSRSLIDLLNSEQEIYQARVENVNAHHDLWLSEADQVAASGRTRAVYGIDHSVVQGLEILP
ncbi:TolC family outer membrane protein [Zymomonas mobilis]|uniref:Type I secretion outer membrane protein, TolC family n=2 Tax=Zymomonas mobilis TaxID=542 RepID=F8ESP3_ZYMMT|nr:TolC family outer membrane protein [Zymomonas mobilis]AEI37818.1 type I secretion outer membrane protein, TolC family [Zymomonas mobilis subsp. pomaceae ATCC 29192]MDX5949185.1 TolC family outer membrane protein [Zymomonas mobilis subsp. pomaceae]GEB89821.1 TolC family type I secretion outer membrane protein [Zymomonas mobilis subsp. pomaceae]